MPTLYDAYGRPVKTGDLTKEFAAPTLTGVRTIWDDTVASGLTPQRLAALLTAAAQGDHYEYLTLAEEMEERDLHYQCELSKRKLAVSRLPAVVEAYSDNDHDQRLADAVRDLVRRPGFRGLLKDLLDGLGKGYAVCELDWDRRGATWYPQRFVWRDPHFFQFDQVTRSELRLRDEADLVNGLPLAPYKFIVHIPKLKSGIPLRGGFARLAAWAFMVKGYTTKDWLAFAEVFGMPLRMGKYGSGASETDINILKMAVANLGSDAAAVFPESMQVELVEAASKAGSAEFFKLLAGYFDDQISKGILGQTASSSGTPGKLGNEVLQAEVRDDIRDDDAEQLAETLNRDLVRPFIDLNFGPQENYPELKLFRAEKDDIDTLTTALKELVPLGLRVEQSVVRDKIGLPDPDPDARPEDLLGALQPDPAPESAAMNRQQAHIDIQESGFSGDQHEREMLADRIAASLVAINRQAQPKFTPEQQALEDFADLVVEQSGETLTGNEALIIEAVQAADSYDDALARLLELYPQLQIDDLQDLLERALVNAELFGRSGDGGA